MGVGIQAINAYVGRTALDVRALFEARGLDLKRFRNLMMEQKSVALPCEDAITNAVNAGLPIVEALSDDEKQKIEFLVVGTESGLDLGKPISTYIHDYLGLGRHCRSFEVKHACYGGTAALQTACAFVATSATDGVKALVLATDSAGSTARMTYSEPSQGTGAVAMLVSESAAIFELDPGANGFYSYEVMDTFRPAAGIEGGDSDLSLLAYLQCLEMSYEHYCTRVRGADLADTFDYLAFHAPFGGMVKGAHRNLVRKHKKDVGLDDVETDFRDRVMPSLEYCVRVGNIYSATLYLALCSLVDNGRFDRAKRVGMFSFGSGCGSEFYSGVIAPRAQERLQALRIAKRLGDRHPLSMEEYETLHDLTDWRIGVENAKIDPSPYGDIYDRKFAGRRILVLDRIRNFHREYRWS